MIFSTMSREHKRQILSPLLGAALVAFVLCQRHAGIGLGLVLPLLIIWLPYSIFVSVFHPQRRPLQLAQMAIWTGAVVTIVSVHYVRHVVTRHNADEIVTTINKYTAQHGHCPATTDDIGITRQELKAKLGLSYYECKDGKQTFVYGVTYMPYDTYSYNFAKATWNRG